MRRLSKLLWTALAALGLALAACGPAEPPLVPGTPEPFSSPGASPDGPPLPP